LRSHENGFVDLAEEKEPSTEWEWLWIRENKFYWKSKHGTYLKGTPDGRI